MCKEMKQYIKQDIGKGNGEMVGRGYHCLMEGLFDFIDTTALWKDIRLHRNGISALCFRRAIIIVRIDIQLIDIRYINMWTDQQAYSIRGRQLCRALYLLLIAIDTDRPFHTHIGQTLGIDRHFHVPIGHNNR